MRALWKSTMLCVLLAGLVLLAGVSPVDHRALEDITAGNRHLNAGEYGAAIAHYLGAMDLLPENDRVAFQLAQAYLGRHNSEPALVLLTRIQEGTRGRQEVSVHAAIGQAWYLKGEHNQAARWWESALTIDPHNRTARLGLAEILNNAGQQGEAACHLRRILAADPGDAKAAYTLGVILLDINPVAAIDSFRQAAEAGEESWSSQACRLMELRMSHSADAFGAAQMGLQLLEFDELLEALRQFELATALAPSYADAHAYRGMLLARLGRPASEAFTMALRLEPDLVLAHYFFGRYHQSFGLAEPARREYEAALRLDRDNPALGIDIALTYAEEGNYVAAEEWLDAAIERAPLNPDLALAQARFYIDRAYRVEERGLPAVDGALFLSPESAEGHDLRGWALYLLGRFDEAVRELRLAVQLDPRMACARAHLGAALLAIEQEDEGGWQLNRAIDLDPTGDCGAWAGSLLE